jgi:NAD(P)H-hydrate epimerase
MRDLDCKAIEGYGIPGVVLMENAGRNAAVIACKMLGVCDRANIDVCVTNPEEQERQHEAGSMHKPGDGALKRVSIFCGKGNNGGDGFVMARHLHNWHVETTLYLLGSKDEVRSNAEINLDIALKMNLPVREILNPEDVLRFKDVISGSDLLIDAIFGTGLKGEVKGLVRHVIDFLNGTGIPVLSVDIPSGLDADTGEILGTCVRATRTVTFAVAKKGFFLNEGPKYTGALTIVDISIPRELLA